MAGFAQMAFASTPFGLGTPATLTAPPTGDSGCRYINPATRDYQQDSESLQLAQMPPLRQRVLLALMTLRRSSTAVRNFGIGLPSKIGTTFEAEMRSRVQQALRHLTELEQAMIIDRIDVEHAGGRGRVTVSYTDMMTGVPDQVSI
jgi:hypothetical protein